MNNRHGLGSSRGDEEVGGLISKTLDVNKGCFGGGREAPYGLSSSPHSDPLKRPEACQGSPQRLFHIGLSSVSSIENAALLALGKTYPS